MERPFDKKAYAIGALRRASYKTRWYNQALQMAKVAYGHYRCAKCQGVFRRKDVQRDHIEPVVPVTGWDSFDGFIDRLFCPPSHIQTLCKPCHKEKSQGENALRRKARKAKCSASKPN